MTPIMTLQCSLYSWLLIRTLGCWWCLLSQTTYLMEKDKMQNIKQIDIKLSCSKMWWGNNGMSNKRYFTKHTHIENNNSNHYHIYNIQKQSGVRKNINTHTGKDKKPTWKKMEPLYINENITTIYDIHESTFHDPTLQCQSYKFILMLQFSSTNATVWVFGFNVIILMLIGELTSHTFEYE